MHEIFEVTSAKMHPNILHLMTATLRASRYKKQYSQPLKNAPFTYENHCENVSNINTERPLEKQA